MVHVVDLLVEDGGLDGDGRELLARRIVGGCACGSGAARLARGSQGILGRAPSGVVDILGIRDILENVVWDDGLGVGGVLRVATILLVVGIIRTAGTVPLVVAQLRYGQRGDGHLSHVFVLLGVVDEPLQDVGGHGLAVVSDHDVYVGGVVDDGSREGRWEKVGLGRTREKRGE